MKKYAFFALAILTITLFLIVLIFFFNRSTQTVIVGPPPAISIIPTTTPAPTDLFVSSVLPPQNPKEPYLPIQKITLTFSEDVKPSDLKYEIEPQTEILIRSGDDKKTLYIIPRTKWEIGSTKITILSSTISTSGKSLYRPFTYNLIVDIPPIPEGVFDIE
jgi:hypothetical protein